MKLLENIGKHKPGPQKLRKYKKHWQLQKLGKIWNYKTTVTLETYEGNAAKEPKELQIHN